MSESNNIISVEDIVLKVLYTTKDTYDVFLELTENRSRHIHDRVLEKLSEPFELLFDKYLKPCIYIKENTAYSYIEYNYSDDDYKEADLNVTSKGILRDEEVSHDAHNIWFERKQKEIKSLLDKYSIKQKTIPTKTYPTFRTSSKVTKEQLLSVFKELQRLEIIDQKVEPDFFIVCFTEKELTRKPHIKFKFEPIILYHVFRLFDKYGIVLDTEKSDIFTKNQLFIDNNGNAFKTPLRTGLNALKEYPKDKTKRQLVEDLESSFQKIFS